MSYTLYSSHIFMFPFRFDWNEKGFSREFSFYKDNSIDKRVKKIDSFEGWEYKPFDLEKQTDLYSEYAYFYDYARDAIYNQSKDDAISCYFEKELTKATYEITILDKDEPYILEIKSLSLRVFHTGVAILSMELENSKYSAFEDILKINDFGRRIYPQYIAEGNSNKTKESFLADSIQIKSKEFNTIENFCFKPSDDIVIGSHVMDLLGASFSQKKDEKNKFYIQPSLDDRMFVLSWYGNDEIVTKLQNDYLKSDDWYRYVFADNKDVTVQNEQMKEQLLKEATYDRWSDNGTLYGLCRYSFVCISTNSDFTKTVLPLPHLKTMYFQMITLLLLARTSILRFSDEIAAVATSKDTDRLQPLYERYLTFYNRLYFKEVTHQDQGIELYDIARKQMKIDEHMEKLDNKFTKLFEYGDLQAEKKRNNSLDKIQLYGAALLIPTLLATIFALDDVKELLFGSMCEKTTGICELGFIVLSGLITYAVISIKKVDNNAK